MSLWVQLRRSGNRKSRSISAASAVARTAIRSVSATRLKAGALGASLLLATAFLSFGAPQRAERVDSALFFTEGRRADSLGLSQQAFEAYSKALDADPTSRAATLAKAGTLLDLNRSAESLELLQSLPASSVDEPERATLLCLALIGQKRGEAATIAQRDALTALAGWSNQDPTRLARVAEGLLRSGTALSRKSQREIAAAVLPAFIRAIEMNTSLSGLILRAADIAITADDLPTAVRYLREFTDDRPQELPILEQIAATLILAGQPTEADSYLQLVAMEKPERANLYPVLGNLYDELGIPARAEMYRVLALHVAKDPPLSDFLRLALLQLKLNQPRRAGLTLVSASRIYSDSVQLLLIRGLTEKAQDLMAEAASTFAQVERLSQKRPEMLDASFYFEYGSACEQSGQSTRSEVALRRALQLNPSHHQSLNYLGYMWAERGRNLDEALIMIEKAVQLSPGNPAYLDSQGWALYRLGNPAAAKPLVEEALRMVPDDPTLLEHYGDINFRLGQKSEAKSAYEKALLAGGPAITLRDKIRLRQNK
jgi:tetratricopeptide (TPR) repeat protein